MYPIKPLKMARKVWLIVWYLLKWVILCKRSQFFFDDGLTEVPTLNEIHKLSKYMIIIWNALIAELQVHLMY